MSGRTVPLLASLLGSVALSASLAREHGPRRSGEGYPMTPEMREARDAAKRARAAAAIPKAEAKRRRKGLKRLYPRSF